MRKYFACFAAMAFVSTVAVAQSTNPRTPLTTQSDISRQQLPYLTPFHDPDFGTYVIRVSGDNGVAAAGGDTFGSDARHHYMTENPWSRHGTYYYMQNGRGDSPAPTCTGTCKDQILNGSTFGPMYSECPSFSNVAGGSASVGDSWWSLQANSEAVRVGETADGKMFLYNVTTCAAVANKAWSSTFAALSTGTSEAQSWNGNKQVVVKSDKKAVQIIDVSTSNSGSPWSTGVGDEFDTFTACGAPTTAGTQCVIDWAQVSPSGNYLVISYDEYDHVRVLDITGTTVSNHDYTIRHCSGIVNTNVCTSDANCTGADVCRPIPFVYTGCVQSQLAKGFIFDVAHASLGPDPYDSNADVVVGANHCSNVGSTQNGQILTELIKVKLSDASVYGFKSILAGIDPDTAIDTGFVKHVSMLAYDFTGYAFVSFTDDRPGKVFDDEIVAVRIGTPPGTVVRPNGLIVMGASHPGPNVLRYTRTHTGNAYRCEAHGVPSPNGSKIAFASCWVAHCGAPCTRSSNTSCASTACHYSDETARQDFVTYSGPQMYGLWDAESLAAAPEALVYATPGMQ